MAKSVAKILYIYVFGPKFSFLPHLQKIYIFASFGTLIRHRLDNEQNMKSSLEAKSKATKIPEYLNDPGIDPKSACNSLQVYYEPILTLEPQNKWDCSLPVFSSILLWENTEFRRTGDTSENQVYTSRVPFTTTRCFLKKLWCLKVSLKPIVCSLQKDSFLINSVFRQNTEFRRYQDTPVNLEPTVRVLFITSKCNLNWSGCLKPHINPMVAFLQIVFSISSTFGAKSRISDVPEYLVNQKLTLSELSTASMRVETTLDQLWNLSYSI